MNSSADLPGWHFDLDKGEKFTNSVRMDREAFLAWRKRMHFTQQEAAYALALTLRAVQHYEGGTRKASARIDRLCYGVERRRYRGVHRSKGAPEHYDPRDIVATPVEFFRRLNRELHFTLDVCAIPSNAKCRRFFTPEQNGLEQSWTGTCWMNPPFFQGQVGKWLKKAHEEVEANGCVVVALIHVRPDAPWFHDYVLKSAEIRFVRGRLNGFPSTTGVVIRKGKHVPKISSMMAKS